MSSEKTFEKGGIQSSASRLLAYQENSVVSRAVLKSEKGNVTLFAFDKGQELSEHTAPFDALVHILEGRAEISISKEIFTLDGGEMILMPADEPHALKAVEPFKMILTMIRK